MRVGLAIVYHALEAVVRLSAENLAATVQEALGHADLKTTSIYVQLAREVMKRELQEHAL